MPRRLPILALFLLALQNPLSAQRAAADSAAPPRVRIQQAGVKQPIIGTLTYRDADSLHLHSAAGDLAIARSDVTRIDVSRGMHSNADRGFKTGLMIGAGLGLLGGIALVAAPEGCWCDAGPEAIPEMMAILGLPGGLLGAGIGSLSHSEQWKKSRIDEPAFAVQVRPWHGQLAVELGMHF